MIDAAEVLTRARSAIGKGCIYRLGKGGFAPGSTTPYLTIGTGCDCSGFAAWCNKVSRLLTNVPHYEGFGNWFETSALVRDARSSFGFVTEVPWHAARPGMLLVWGDHDGHQGHVGICSEVGADGPTKAIHCSTGNLRAFGDAIAETSADLFKHNGALVAAVSWVNYNGEVGA